MFLARKTFEQSSLYKNETGPRRQVKTALINNIILRTLLAVTPINYVAIDYRISALRKRPDEFYPLFATFTTQ